MLKDKDCTMSIKENARQMYYLLIMYFYVVRLELCDTYTNKTFQFQPDQVCRRAALFSATPKEKLQLYTSFCFQCKHRLRPSALLENTKCNDEYICNKSVSAVMAISCQRKRKYWGSTLLFSTKWPVSKMRGEISICNKRCLELALLNIGTTIYYF